MINYIALLVAVGLSSVAAYFSILGLTAIFAASYWPVIIMGSMLEAAKVVASGRRSEKEEGTPYNQLYELLKKLNLV